MRYTIDNKKSLQLATCLTLCGMLYYPIARDLVLNFKMFAPFF